MLVLSGPEKAVLFLLSLDESVAAPIVNELTEDDLRKLRAVASTMRQIHSGAIDETFRDFLGMSRGAVAVPRGGLRYLRRLSTGALGEERTSRVFEDGVTSPFARLEAAPADAVASLLEAEPPQLCGAILARMAPTAAAEIISRMTDDRQAAVIAHVSRMTDVQASLLEDVAQALARELPSADTVTAVNIDGIAKAAEILNAANRDASKAILATIEAMDETLAKNVRQAMFTFEDLVRIDNKSMRELLREVATDRLTLALKGASDAVKGAIFAGLSSRAADLISDDLELLGNVKKTEIEAARLEVVQAALTLEGDGRISLGRDAE